MRAMLASAVVLGLVTAFAGCGGSDGTVSTAPAASVGTGPNADAPTSSATKASASLSAPTSAPAGSAGDTCKFLSPSEASTLLANPGPATVTSMDTATSKQTTCSWGTGATNRITLVANEFNSSAPLAAIKRGLDRGLVEKIDGLGDVGGFRTKDATGVTVLFFKGTTQVTLSVASTSANANAVVAAAKKMASGL